MKKLKNGSYLNIAIINNLLQVVFQRTLEVVPFCDCCNLSGL